MSPEDNKLLSSPEFTMFLLERLGQTATIVVDSKCSIIYWSQRAEKLFGLQSSAVLGQEYETTLPLFDAQGKQLPNRKRLIWEALHTVNYKRVTPFFCYGKDPSGRLFQIAMHAIVYRKRGRVTAVVLEAREVKRIINVGEMKTLFISFAAHQLKTPSSIVKGFLELMLREGQNRYSQEQWGNLESAHEANERLIALSRALLNLTKLEGGLIEPRLNTVNMAELIKEKLASHQATADKKNITIHFTALGPGAFFETDETIFAEIFEIVIGNAIKFSPAQKSITITLATTGEEAVLQVTDQGPGIPASQRSQLFSTTFKTDPASGGHGLGLAMAKKYLTLLGGRIAVDSTEG